jgi:hypothetical protein
VRQQTYVEFLSGSFTPHTVASAPSRIVRATVRFDVGLLEVCHDGVKERKRAKRIEKRQGGVLREGTELREQILSCHMDAMPLVAEEHSQGFLCHEGSAPLQMSKHAWELES